MQRLILHAILLEYPVPPDGDADDLDLVDDDLRAFERSIGIEDYDEGELPKNVRWSHLNLEHLVHLSRIHIHKVGRDKVAYVGYEFARA